MPNAVMRPRRARRNYVGSQIEEFQDVSGISYRRAFEKGYMTDLEVERVIWDHVFSACLKVEDEKKCCLVLTEPPFNFAPIQAAMDEVIFEEYNFGSFFRHPAYSFVGYEAVSPQHPSVTVVDSGFSFTHVIPLFHSPKAPLPRPFLSSIRRLNVGGKTLTNYMMELVSYRALDLSSEPLVVERLKEDVCFVAPRITQTLRKPALLAQNYLLPDFGEVLRGRVLEAGETSSKQTVRVASERCWVPELLFSPSIAGIEQMGLSDAVAEAISTCHPEVRPLLYGNVLACGGTALLPGFCDRLSSDLRERAVCGSPVNVRLAENAVTHTWTKAARFARSSAFAATRVTRAEYEERGPNACARFAV